MAVGGGDVAVVTGANRGLGLEVAKQLAKKGIPVVLAGRDTAKLQDAAKEVWAAGNNEGIVAGFVAFDASSDDSVRAAAKTLAAEYGSRITLVVNNAGIAVPGWDASGYRQCQQVNFKSGVLFIYELLPFLPEGATILNVTSELGRLALLSPAYRERVESAQTLEDLYKLEFDPNDTEMAAVKVVIGMAVANYSASKAVMNKATKLIAADPRVVEKKIKVNAVSPGWCATDMGTDKAPRTPQQGATSILYAAFQVPDSGTFYVEEKLSEW